MQVIGSTLLAALALCFLPFAPATAQEKSVRPGINKPFEHPDPQDDLKQFEEESRELAAPAREIVAACKLQPGRADYFVRFEKPAQLQGKTASQKAQARREFVAASPDEPLAKNWSLTKAAEHLDQAATTWLTHWKCAACHTSYLYVMAGPSLSTRPSPALLNMRHYLEYRVTHWDSGQAADKPGQGSAIKPLPTEGVTEVVATAATLAFLDSQTTGKLHPVTRQALDRLWGLQQPSGAWTWNRTNLAPLEYDDYFGAVFAALGVGAAPEGYSQTALAHKGLARLRTYFQNNRPPNLHHKVWLLWASTRMDRLLTPADRQQTIAELAQRQQEDGGWSLPSLWKPSPIRAKDKPVASDGYATGLALYVLRQANVPPQDRRMAKGLAWLKTHQRESGRWFTPSLNGSRRHLITNAGTALCAMALRACGCDGK